MHLKSRFLLPEAWLRLKLKRDRYTSAKDTKEPNYVASEQLISGLQIGLVVVDEDYDIRFINVTARRLLSIHGEVGENVLHQVPPVVLAPLRSALEAARRGGSVTIMVEGSPTSEGPVHFQLSCTSQELRDRPAPWPLVIQLADVSRIMREHVRSMEEANQQIAYLTEATTVADQQVEGLNREVAGLSQAKAQLVGTNLDPLRSPEQTIGGEAAQAIEAIEGLKAEPHATNEELEMLNAELHSANEELKRTNEDLNARTAELLMTAAALDRQRRLQGDFLAMASHELRTPLAVQKMALDQLLHRYELSDQDDTGRAYAVSALEQAQRLSGMLDNLLDVMRLQAGSSQLRLEPVELGWLAKETAATVQQQCLARSIDLQVDSPALLWVMADVSRLQQMLRQLVQDTLDYTPEKARVIVRLRASAGNAEIEVLGHRPTLVGDDLHAVLTRFYDEEREGFQAGVGLSLFICRELSHAMGGTLDVRAAGELNSLVVRLPILTTPQS